MCDGSQTEGKNAEIRSQMTFSGIACIEAGNIETMVLFKSIIHGLCKVSCRQM